MTPVASWSPADYYHASRAARRAWQRSQPQQVIPGVLEEVDVARAETSLPAAASTSSSASVPAVPPDPKGDALDLNDNGPGRITPTVLRGRGQ